MCSASDGKETHTVFLASYVNAVVEKKKRMKLKCIDILNIPDVILSSLELKLQIGSVSLFEPDQILLSKLEP